MPKVLRKTTDAMRRITGWQTAAANLTNPGVTSMELISQENTARPMDHQTQPGRALQNDKEDTSVRLDVRITQEPHVAAAVFAAADSFIFQRIRVNHRDHFRCTIR